MSMAWSRSLCHYGGYLVYYLNVPSLQDGLEVFALKSKKISIKMQNGMAAAAYTIKTASTHSISASEVS